MTKLNLFFLSVIGLLVLFSLAACASTPEPIPTPLSPTSPAPVADFPMTISDDLGRQVTLTAKPERIISLLPSNTEILFAVGAGDQVIGVTSYCNYPPEAATRQQIGGITVQSISVETVIALEPDLILATQAQTELIDTLAEIGLTVITLHPRTLDDIYANIELVGRVTGHADQATTLAADLRRRAETVQSTSATIPDNERLRVFYEVWHDPLITAGPHTVIGQVIELAGGDNIFADVNEDWPQVSPEVIVTRNPAVILGPDSHGDVLTGEKIAGRPGWANIDAVQNGRVYLFDGDAISRPGPRIIDMLEEIARDLYPDRF
jgi:iron complex transport system substrate-binding protein